MPHFNFLVLHRVQALPRGSLLGAALTTMRPFLPVIGAAFFLFGSPSRPLKLKDSIDESELVGDEGGGAVSVLPDLSSFPSALPTIVLLSLFVPTRFEGSFADFSVSIAVLLSADDAIDGNE